MAPGTDKVAEEPVPVTKNVESKKKGNGKKQKKEQTPPKEQQPLVNGNHEGMNGHASDSSAEQQKDQNGEAAKKKSESEVMEIIQDSGFTVQILSPGVEPLSIQVSSMELVQEIHQLLMDREDTCHRTCFSLQLDGVTLDNFAELKNVEGLKEGSVIKVVEEPYTMREARIHVRHVRDLLKSMDPADA